MSYYKQLTVRTELHDADGNLQYTGSGIACAYQMRQYVLTAYHCINPQNSTRPEDWTICLFTENGQQIQFIRIVGELKDRDIAVIEVEHPDSSITEDRVQLYCTDVYPEKYLFRGFPKFMDYKAHTFQVVYSDDNWWNFVLQDVSAERKSAINLLEGASGSGVLFDRRGKYFIVGIALHLHDTEGSLNQVYVAPISEFKAILPAAAFKTFGADLLKDWEEGMDEELTKKQIDELKQEQIAWIDNIVRKLKVMYPEQYQQKLNTFLGYYVKGREFFVKQGESNSTFRDALSKMTESFFAENQPDPQIYVDTPGEAETKFNSLKDELVNEMSAFIPEDSKNNKVGNNYARYRLTDRLLVCTLEYIKRESR